MLNPGFLKQISFLPITPLHILEGALPITECIIGYVITGIILGFILYFKRLKIEDIPRIALITIVFFVASFIHVNIGPSSVHPLFIGLLGILLGPYSFLGILIALFLQAILAGHGGITTLGVNTIDMGLPAVLTYLIFKCCVSRVKSWKGIFALSCGLGCFSVLIAIFFTIIALVIANPAYLTPSIILVTAHIPVIVAETIITGVVVSVLAKVRPEILISTYGEVIKKVLK